MLSTSLFPSRPRHVVAIVGGAVAGSEAAAVCAARGIGAVVLEQGARPFGKIEDGLPRWHDKLRQKEYEQIGRNLSAAGVLFVPCTQFGVDVTLTELREQWGVSAVLLASGAWRDRPLFDGSDRFVGKGLVQQNAFVHWYNHYPEDDYADTAFSIHDEALVVGGGLASIDVVKIVSFELFKRALASRGIRVTTLELEHAGIPATLATHGLSQTALGVKGVTLFYRREKTAMPIAQAPEGATPQQLEKIGLVRAKLMDKVIEKYLVNFVPNRALSEPIIEHGILAGLRFRRTETVGDKLITHDETHEVRSRLIISSIGSVPVVLPGLPMRGELIDFEDWNSGKVRGFDNVFGLGNALTGKGNIKDSRRNAHDVSARLIEEYLVGSDGDLAAYDQAHRGAQEGAARIAQITAARAPLPEERIEYITTQVQRHWQRTGYSGDYGDWMARHARRGEEREAAP